MPTTWRALIPIVLLAAAVPRAAAAWPVRPEAHGDVAVEREESAPVSPAGAAPATGEAPRAASLSPAPAAEPSRPSPVLATPTPTPSRTGPVASSGAVVGDKRNAIYVEILGSAFFGSINYERRTAYNFCLRIGVTPFASRDVVALIIPITVTKLLGTDGPWPELGFGATFFGAVFRREPDGQFAALFGGSGDSVFSIYRKQPFFHAFVGYRWAPPATENAVVRLGITPLFFHEEYPKVWRLHWWGGLSIGRAF